MLAAGGLMASRSLSGAAAGHNFYTARAFPEEYWNRVAFVNEPTGHVVHRAIIERQGSGFAGC